LLLLLLHCNNVETIYYGFFKNKLKRYPLHTPLQLFYSLALCLSTPANGIALKINSKRGRGAQMLINKTKNGGGGRAKVAEGESKT